MPPLFEELVGMLRATEEWTYVEREVDVRVVQRGVTLHAAHCSRNFPEAICGRPVTGQL